MADKLVKSIMLKIRADDGDTEEKIKQISLKADELAAKHPELKVRIDTAAASAKLAVLRQELKDIGKQSDDTGSKLSQMFSKLTSGSSGMGGIPLIGGLADKIPGGPAGGVGVLLAAVSAAQALMVEVTGLATGFVAAGLGVGSLGLLALPTFKKIENAYTSISQAQANYSAALEKEKLDPTKTNLAAVATAALNLKVAQQQAGPGVSQFLGGIQKLQGAFDKLANSMQPQIVKIFNDGLQIANQLLPYVGQFAKAAAPAVESLMKSLSKQIDSRGFKDFMQRMEQISPAAITAIGNGIGQLAGDVGQLLMVMSKKDVIHSINIAFDALGLAIKFVTAVIETSMKEWDMASGAYRRASHDIGVVINDAKHLASDLGGLASAAGSAGTRMSNAISGAAGAVIGWFQRLPGRIVAALGGLGSALFNAGRNAIHSLASGIESAIGSVTGPMASIAGEIRKFLPFSPAKKGPLSGSGSPDIAGAKIPAMLAAGMTAGTAAVSAAAGRMAGAAVTGVGGGVGGGRMEVVLTGSPNTMALLHLLWPDLRATVRTKGGAGPYSVQRALGEVVPT